MHGSLACQSHESTSLRWPSSPPKIKAQTPVLTFQTRTLSSRLALRRIACGGGIGELGSARRRLSKQTYGDALLSGPVQDFGRTLHLDQATPTARHSAEEALSVVTWRVGSAGANRVLRVYLQVVDASAVADDRSNDLLLRFDECRNTY